jgi:hypothetical protein
MELYKVLVPLNKDLLSAKHNSILKTILLLFKHICAKINKSSIEITNKLLFLAFLSGPLTESILMDESLSVCNFSEKWVS